MTTCTPCRERATPSINSHPPPYCTYTASLFLQILCILACKRKSFLRTGKVQYCRNSYCPHDHANLDNARRCHMLSIFFYSVPRRRTAHSLNKQQCCFPVPGGNYCILQWFNQTQLGHGTYRKVWVWLGN